MFKYSCRRMKCDEGSDAWNNVRISHIHVCLKILANMYRERKTWSSRKFGESNFLFFAKMAFSRWKNLEQPSYTKVRVTCWIILVPGWVRAWSEVWVHSHFHAKGGQKKKALHALSKHKAGSVHRVPEVEQMLSSLMLGCHYRWCGMKSLIAVWRGLTCPVWATATRVEGILR